MFTIIPCGETTIRQQLGEFAGIASTLLSAVVSDATLPSIEQRPSVQLSHQEIGDDEVERVLGFAGISSANAPVGIPAAMQVQRFGPDFLLFSLGDLAAHLAITAPDVIAGYERYGTLSAFAASREIAAFEYLVAGLMECTRWCQTHRAALSIRW